MNEKKLKRKPWYPMAVAICIGILFYFLLSNLDTIGTIIGTIAYYLYPVIAGVILAYLINPLMKIFEEKVLKVFKSKTLRRILALVLSLVIVIVLITLVIVILVPQLYDSIITIYNNKDDYLQVIYDILNKFGATSILTYIEGLFSGSESLFDKLIGYISDNGSWIKEGVISLGGHLGAWGIGLIFSVYFLAEKDKIKEVSKNLLKSIQKDKELTETTLMHLTRMDTIVTKYIMMSIIDSIILGVANAIFMTILGMEYVGLVSVVIGVTNLIPTFGPIIGIVVGGIILVLSNPLHALYFVIFMTAAMMIDGYLIRPKLFGKTLGVSGLWILIAVIVGGRILGVIGILLSIPVVAIIDYLIKEVYFPIRRAKLEEKALKDKKAKEKRAKEKEKKAAEKEAVEKVEAEREETKIEEIKIEETK